MYAVQDMIVDFATGLSVKHPKLFHGIETSWFSFLSADQCDRKMYYIVADFVHQEHAIMSVSHKEIDIQPYASDEPQLFTLQIHQSVILGGINHANR